MSDTPNTELPTLTMDHVNNLRALRESDTDPETAGDRALLLDVEQHVNARVSGDVSMIKSDVLAELLLEVSVLRSRSRDVVLVCGGRDYREQSVVFETLAAIHSETPISCIVHGGAAGADYLAALWTKIMCIPSAEYPAKWEQHGKSAGPRRNEWMLHDAHPNLVVAFPGGKGTAHMVKIAKASGVRVIEIAPPCAECKGKFSQCRCGVNWCAAPQQDKEKSGNE